MQTKSTIYVTVPIQISIPSSWGPGFTIAEIVKQSKEKAFTDLTNILKGNSALNDDALEKIRKQVVLQKGDAKVKVTLEEE